jgi:membrane associated rhomboid family serine protease
MGIGDRAYMRNQRPYREPISATAWTVGVLIAFFIINLIQESAGADLLGWMALSKMHPQPWQYLTHALLHDGFWHLLGNCLVLWWTGVIVEQEYGVKVFFLTLIGGVLLGALTWFFTGINEVYKIDLKTGLPIDPRCFGISAGVYALLLVALMDKLEHQITLLLFFFLPVTLKVRWMLLLTALFTLLGWIFAELPDRHDWPKWHAAWTDSIAHSAHLGGLVLGFFAWRTLNRTNQGPSYAQVQMPSAEAPSPSFEAPTEENSPRALTQTQARAELDGLLDKISDGGFGSLTPAEKRRLEDLSARLR